MKLIPTVNTSGNVVKTHINSLFDDKRNFEFLNSLMQISNFTT